LSPEWLGKTITRENLEEFLAEVLSKGTDPCGEYGEYHTLVTRIGKQRLIIEGNSLSIHEKSNTLYISLRATAHSK